MIVRRSKVSPCILLVHANAQSQSTAKYPTTRVGVKSFTLHTGILGNTLDNVILSQLPTRILICFVDNRDFNGSRKFNPFNFHHFIIYYLSLYVDGVQIPNKPLQPCFNDGQYINAFHSILYGTRIHYINEGIGINRESYAQGHFILGFDLTPDGSANSISHLQLACSGSVRIEVRFEQVLTVTVNCILYSEFQNIIDFDSNRHVIADFSV